MDAAVVLSTISGSSKETGVQWRILPILTQVLPAKHAIELLIQNNLSFSFQKEKSLAGLGKLALRIL